MRKMFIYGLIATTAAALGACDSRPKTAEWQNFCVESHSEFQYFITTYVSCGTNCTTPVMTPIYASVCDKHEVQCVPGRDGTKVCS